MENKGYTEAALRIIKRLNGKPFRTPDLGKNGSSSLMFRLKKAGVIVRTEHMGEYVVAKDVVDIVKTYHERTKKRGRARKERGATNGASYQPRATRRIGPKVIALGPNAVAIRRGNQWEIIGNKETFLGVRVAMTEIEEEDNG